MAVALALQPPRPRLTATPAGGLRTKRHHDLAVPVQEGGRDERTRPDLAVDAHRRAVDPLPCVRTLRRVPSGRVQVTAGSCGVVSTKNPEATSSG